MKRPKEIYYNMKFRGNTTFAIDQQKVANNVLVFQRNLKDWNHKDELADLQDKHDRKYNS